MIEFKKEKMASSSAEVPYNHPTENVLFGQNVIEKITDTCLGQDGKRYYQVKWRESWEPEERLMTACEGALQTFWKEYYANVEKEIRKQVITASITPNKHTLGQTAQIIEEQVQQAQKNVQAVQAKVNTVTGPVASTSKAIGTGVVESFPEQSSTVAYYAVQGDIDGNTENVTVTNTHQQQPQQLTTKDIITTTTTTEDDSDEVAEQAQILTQIINATPGITATKWADDKDLTGNRRTLTTITADTLNTKSVGGPDSNSKFHCDICMKTFVSKRNVQRHMLSHTGEKPWMCEYCFKRFRQKPHLEQHVNIHKGIKNAVCSICGKAFNHRSNLVTHMATHSTARPHTCEVCGETFKLKHTLAKHMMVHSKLDVNKRHQCKECKRSFRDKSYLTEHETIHRKEKPYQCDICMKAFSFKRRFQMHLEVHRASDGGDEYVCHICPKKFKSKGYLQKHLERHENKRRKKKKRKEGEISKEQGAEGVIQDGIPSGEGGEGEADVENDSCGEAGDDDVEMSISEVDVKAEGELEEGETLGPHTMVTNTGNLSNLQHSNEAEGQIIQIEGTDENDPNMVVASMLPMSSLNMEDPATYVALAQLTQAAIESAPMDETGNVILMSYEDIQKSMQEIQAAQQQEQQSQTETGGVEVDLAIHDIQIAQQQQQDELTIVTEVQTQDDGTEEYVQVRVNESGVITTDHEMTDLEGQVELEPGAQTT